MYPTDKNVFLITKTLVEKYGKVLPSRNWDAFSESEKTLMCPEQSLEMGWGRRLISKDGISLLKAELIEIKDLSYEDEEDDVVFQALVCEGEDVIETFFYYPDEWLNELFAIGEKEGIIT